MNQLPQAVSLSSNKRKDPLYLLEASIDEAKLKLCFAVDNPPHARNLIYQPSLYHGLGEQLLLHNSFQPDSGCT